MEWNGEALSTFVVAAGGAWMVGASLTHRAGNYNATQRRGLLLSGSGFLITAGSARWMQSYGALGIGVSMVGTATVMAGMYILVKERAERRAAEESESRK